MITELQTESQITLPRAMIDKLGLAVGDLLDVSERDGGVFIVPVAVAKHEGQEMSPAEYKQFLLEMCGCIDDPTFVEPPEIQYESPTSNGKLPRSALRGSLKGKVWMADDFDAPLDEMREYME